MEKKTDYLSLVKLFLRSIFISIIGAIFPFIYILFPSMFIVESIKEGILKVMGTLALVVGVVSIGFGAIYGLVIFTIFAPLILMFYYMIITNKSVAQTIIVTAFTFFTSILVLMYAFGINAEVLNSNDTYLNIANFYKEIATKTNLSLTEISSLEQNFQYMYRSFLQSLPSILIIASLILSYITYTMVGRTLITKGKFITQPSSLEFLRIPQNIVILSVITAIGVYIFKDNLGALAEVFNINLVNIIGFFLFATGLGVVKFNLTRFGVKRFMQGVFVMFCITFSFLQIFVAVIGAFDYIFNFRKLRN